MTISTHLAISKSMSSFVPKYWLNWQILVAFLNELRRQRWDHQSVHTCPPLIIEMSTVQDITEKMNFDIPFMIWRKNFEIRIVLLGELPSRKDYLSLLSYFDLSPRFSSRLYNSTPKGYFFNAFELLKCPTM